jgi:hypothetical protein
MMYSACIALIFEINLQNLKCLKVNNKHKQALQGKQNCPCVASWRKLFCLFFAQISWFIFARNRKLSFASLSFVKNVPKSPDDAKQLRFSLTLFGENVFFVVG